MKKYFYISFLLLIAILIFSCLLNRNKEPIKIGLMVTLTGVYPDLGREIRDGVMLAVNMINEEGGIKGSKIKLIIRDNKYDINIAKSNYEELYKEGVIAVIGPATSTTAKNLLPTINELKLLTIAPTPTSTKLAGLDDYMIRLRPTNREEAQIFASYILEKLKLNRVAIVYDIINPEYTHDFIENFRANLPENFQISTYPFDEKKKNIKELSQKIINNSTQAALILVDVYNASLFIQNLKKLNKNLIILTSIWAKSPKLIEHCGRWAEGIIVVDITENGFEGKVERKFFETYGRPMSFASINGYDSVLILKRAIEQGAKRENLRDMILRIGKFEGLQGEIIFDKFGDRKVKPFVLKIENGKYKRVWQ